MQMEVVYDARMAGDKMIYVSKSAESTVRLAEAIAHELPGESFSSLVAHALKRHVRYLEKTMPDAVGRARTRSGVHT